MRSWASGSWRIGQIFCHCHFGRYGAFLWQGGYFFHSDFLIGICMGLKVSGGAEVLGRSTASSVVTCIAAIIAADTVFALVL